MLNTCSPEERSNGSGSDEQRSYGDGDDEL
jgi:hypothetical protein